MSPASRQRRSCRAGSHATATCRVPARLRRTPGSGCSCSGGRSSPRCAVAPRPRHDLALRPRRPNGCSSTIGPGPPSRWSLPASLERRRLASNVVLVPTRRCHCVWAARGAPSLCPGHPARYVDRRTFGRPSRRSRGSRRLRPPRTRSVTAARPPCRIADRRRGFACTRAPRACRPRRRSRTCASRRGSPACSPSCSRG
jgi:hypothetical protein